MHDEAEIAKLGINLELRCFHKGNLILQAGYTYQIIIHFEHYLLTAHNHWHQDHYYTGAPFSDSIETRYEPLPIFIYGITETSEKRFVHQQSAEDESFKITFFLLLISWNNTIHSVFTCMPLIIQVTKSEYMQAIATPQVPHPHPPHPPKKKGNFNRFLKRVVW